MAVAIENVGLMALAAVIHGSLTKERKPVEKAGEKNASEQAPI
jgi:hypothetical protein